MSTQIDRLTELAKEDPKRQFYSIAHMITFGALYAAFRGLRKKASAGVDGVTYDMYERDAAGNIQALHERLRNGKYQAQPLRRVYIRKEDGKQRPLSIPALEDKIVQKATAEILNAIYEQDFLDCSYEVSTRKRAAPSAGRSETSHLYSAHGVDPGYRCHCIFHVQG